MEAEQTDFDKIDAIKPVTIQGNLKKIITDLSYLDYKLKPCSFSLQDIETNKQIAADMITTIQYHMPNCFSLSANQIGENKRMFAFHRSFKQETSQHDFVVILNPRMVPLKSRGMRKYEESCLSYPETLKGRANMHLIRRYKNIKLFFQNIYGTTDQLTFSGKLAAAIQHEMDHMNGIIR